MKPAPKLIDKRPSRDALLKRIGAAAMRDVREAVLLADGCIRHYESRVLVRPSPHPVRAWEDTGGGKVELVPHRGFVVYRLRTDGKIDGWLTVRESLLRFENPWTEAESNLDAAITKRRAVDNATDPD